MSDLVPLDLYVEVVKPSGRSYRWDGGYRAQDTPQNLSFSSKRGTGFDTITVSLPRDLELEYPDLDLFDDIYVRSATGQVRYHGRVTNIDRSTGPDGDTISVSGVGWMAHMQDQKVPLLYVDQDPTRWQPVTLARQAVLAAGSFDQGKIPAETSRGLSWAPPNAALAINTATELSFDAGPGVTVAKVVYKGARTGAFTNFEAATLFAADDPDLSVSVTTVGTLTLDSTVRTQPLTTAQRALMLRCRTSAATTPAVGHLQRYDVVATYGNHGLTTHAITDIGDGIYASDILRHLIASYCPRLNSDGVSDTTLPIEHFSFPDPTTPYDAALKLNGFHIWELAVWEDHTVHWGPLDLTDWDWEVRTDDYGVEVGLQGDSAADLVNCAIVHYDQLPSRTKTTLYPTDSDDLVDSSEDNPANSHGLGYKPVEITPSFPMIEDTAIEIGRTALAEARQAKRPGTITCSSGYVRDRQGNLQPASMVRAGDRIRITNVPADLIRPIGEVQYDHDSTKLTIGVDSSIERMEGFFNRVDVGLQARGLAA